MSNVIKDIPISELDTWKARINQVADDNIMVLDEENQNKITYRLLGLMQDVVIEHPNIFHNGKLTRWYINKEHYQRDHIYDVGTAKEFHYPTLAGLPFSLIETNIYEQILEYWDGLAGCMPMGCENLLFGQMDNGRFVVSTY